MIYVYVLVPCGYLEGQRRLSSKGCYMVHLQLAKWVGAGENVLITTPIIIKMTRENSEVVDMDIIYYSDDLTDI